MITFFAVNALMRVTEKAQYFLKVQSLTVNTNSKHSKGNMNLLQKLL